MARGAGFVLAEAAPDVGQSFFFGVVQAQAVLFMGREMIERGLQGAREKRKVMLAAKIGGVKFTAECGVSRRKSGFFLGKFGEAAGRAEGIDVTLGQDGAEPGFE